MKHKRLRFSIRRYMQDMKERDDRWMDRVIEAQDKEWKERQEAIWSLSERGIKNERRSSRFNQ